MVMNPREGVSLLSFVDICIHARIQEESIRKDTSGDFQLIPGIV